jgi:KDO2-lipid IV(A) lauroyltransferase
MSDVPRADIPVPGVAQETWGERFAYWYYRSAELTVAAFPERLGRRMFRAAAAAQHALREDERWMVAGNLARVLGKPPESGEVRAAVREAFDSYGRYWFDTFLLRVLPPEEIRKRFEMRGLEAIDDALERGRGALLCLPHLGNWDAAGRWMTMHGYGLTAVAEVLRPPRLFELFLEHRRQLGIGIVPLSDTRKVGEQLVGLLAKNELIALVADRDLKGRGVDVEMFGAPRKLPAGPALLSLSLDVPLIPVAMYDTDEDGWLCVVDEVLEIERTGNMRADVAALTRELGCHFERSIAAAPTQWHMWQPAWPEDEE